MSMYHKGGGGRPRGFGFGGFHLAGKKPEQQLGESALGRTGGGGGVEIPPPRATNKQGYIGLQAITQNALDASYGIPRKRPKTEEEYFDEEDEEQTSNSHHHKSSHHRHRSSGAGSSSVSHLEYIPAPGSPSWDNQQDQSDHSRSPSPSNSTSSEEDPLDAYMAGLQKQVSKEAEQAKEKTDSKKDVKGIRDDIENEDDEESYYRYIEENPNAGADGQDSDVELEYDEDGNPIAPTKSKYIDPLPPVDHSTIEYSEFNKNFYEEHQEIVALDDAQIQELRIKLDIKVSGVDAPKPVTSFGHFGFEERLLKAVRKSEYTQPTPIQAQGVPIALSGRDMIGIAKTGSGKTAAFIWPMLVHIMDQKELEDDDGPVGLILAPTRELAQQIYLEAKKFGKVYGLRVVCCFGGGSKWEQSQALQEGAEIIVATPGRMIDMIKIKATNLKRVTFLVLDEADRMFDMGFEPQVRSICDHVRPDRQTLMFSATFKKKVERLARVALTDPVRVVHGELGEANQDVTQYVLVMPSGPNKWTWLTKNLVDFTSVGSVLIFVTKKANSDELATNLKARDLSAGLLHGDMDQNERTKIIAAFKRKEFPILVATDVAARGLDIPHIKTVVNYDVARDIDTHTHRVGRTGRAGEKGIAYTLVTQQDKEFAGHLVRNLEGANQAVPSALMDLAMQSSWFRKSRFKQGKAKKANVGGRGLGYKEKPSVGGQHGSESSTTSSPVVPASISQMRGPQTDRLSAMKAAFQLQYKNQFQPSSDNTLQNTFVTPAPPLPPPPPPPPPPTSSENKQRRKKTRWDD